MQQKHHRLYCHDYIIKYIIVLLSLKAITVKVNYLHFIIAWDYLCLSISVVLKMSNRGFLLWYIIKLKRPWSLQLVLSFVYFWKNYFSILFLLWDACYWNWNQILFQTFMLKWISKIPVNVELLYHKNYSCKQLYKACL